MELSRNKYLFKNTAIFTLGNLATKFITFFLIPLYTNVLSTSEYGIVDFVITITLIAVPILSLNIMESVIRFNLDKDVNHDKITLIGIIVFVIVTIVGLFLIPLCSYFSSFSELGWYVYFYFITSASCQIFLSDLRGKELLIEYSVGNVVNTFLIAIFNILFLLGLKWGIRGYLSAYILANLLVTFYAIIVGKGYKAIRASVDIKLMKAMVKYSVVLIPNAFMWWIMNSSDHLMVTAMIGVEANGIYAISYKVPTLISTIIGIFNQAWGYSAIKEEAADDIEEYSNSVFNSLISVTMLVGIGMMTFIKPFLRIYVSSDYYIAWRYTPFLIVGCVFLTLGTFMGTSYTVHKDSKGFVLSGMLGAVLNVILNYILIPIIGINGAAFSTCISYILVFGFRGIHTRKYLKYQIFTKEFIVGVICLIISGILVYSETLWAQLIQIVMFVALLYILKKYWLGMIIKIFGKVIKR